MKVIRSKYNGYKIENCEIRKKDKTSVSCREDLEGSMRTYLIFVHGESGCSRL